ISTIHSLCARVLRQYPFAAGVDPQFEVLDELQTTVQLPAVVRDSLLNGLAEERASAGLAIGYYEGLSKAAGALQALIARREKYRRFLENLPSPDELLAEWERVESEWLERRLEALRASETFREVAHQVEAAAEIARSEPDDRLSPSVLEMADLVATLPEPEAQAVAEWIENLERVSKPGSVGRDSVWEELGGAKAVRDLLKAVVEAVLLYLKPVKDTVPGDRQTAEVAAALWQEAQGALEAWERFKDLVPALDYDDLQSKLRDLLRDEDAVRLEIQSRFKHVLVDEFQDTSQLQREVIELVSGLQERPAEAARVFVVGDPKQSIYRFRDADVTVYNQARERFEADEGCEVRRLSTSFRPNTGLMAYFNEVFATPELLGAEPEHPFDTRYEQMHAMREFVPVQPPAVGLLVVDQNSEILYRRVAEGRAIANFIEHLLNDPPFIYDHDAGPDEPRYRPLRAGDIAILFRAMTEAYLYEDQLWEKGLPYYNASSRGLFTRPEITDMVNVLRVLADPADEVALVGVLRSPMFAINDETLFRLAQDRRRTWWERLQAAGEQASRTKAPYDALAPDQRRRLERAALLLRTWRRQREHRALSALVRDIIERTGYSAAMAAQVSGVRAVANLGKLTDLARRFEQTGQAGVRAFAQFLTTLAEEDSQEAQAPTEEEKSDSIWLSSVHAAKGLQWPVVIVADLTRPPHGSEEVPRSRLHPNWGLVPAEPGPPGTRRWRLMARIIAEQESLEQEAENKRLLYVAMTRASDLLVLSSSVQQSGEKLRPSRGGSWLDLLLRASQIELSKTEPPEGLEVLRDSPLCPWYLVPSDCEELPRLVRQPLPKDLAEEAEELTPGAPGEHGPAPSTPPERAAEDTAQPAQRPLSPRSGIEVALTRVPPDVATRRRFSVTELAHYLACPQYHKLRYVDGLPDLSP
ncbi:MAG: UvrD-helicase domain-containing protein, partial [Armatimonadetes bacterium]|nr:UvrD-helicase domain-containing protein [Armatimonadota bacterium]